MKRGIIALIVIALFLSGGFYFARRFFTNNDPTASPPRLPGTPPPSENGEMPDVETVVENLTIPWDIAFLSDGSLLVTERGGTLLKISANHTRIPIEGVEHAGEGGLLGIALHPNFNENGWIYLYLTTRSGEGLVNRVERYRLDGNRVVDRTTIIDNIPGARFHDGGRIAFGPDNMLYITTGDAGNELSAQDTSALSGKILRVRDDGSIPEDNPFGNAVYSYGHRNPQGLAWDNDGNLWSTEHGRSGILSGLDELNRIVAGENYGWPVIQGDEINVDMNPPVINSGSDVTWAPASALYWDGSIFFGGLRGETLYEATLSGTVVTGLRTHFVGEFGRIRTVALGPSCTEASEGGPDCYFYITTSNRDGRGSPNDGDDKIIRVNPAQFR